MHGALIAKPNLQHGHLAESPCPADPAHPVRRACRGSGGGGGLRAGRQAGHGRRRKCCPHRAGPGGAGRGRPGRHGGGGGAGRGGAGRSGAGQAGPRAKRDGPASGRACLRMDFAASQHTSRQVRLARDVHTSAQAQARARIPKPASGRRGKRGVHRHGEHTVCRGRRARGAHGRSALMCTGPSGMWAGGGGGAGVQVCGLAAAGRQAGR